MTISSEFKEFALKGNVMDLAIGVIIGAAFGAREGRMNRTHGINRISDHFISQKSSI